jgi:hypothetical protein
MLPELTSTVEPGTAGTLDTLEDWGASQDRRCAQLLERSVASGMPLYHDLNSHVQMLDNLAYKQTNNDLALLLRTGRHFVHCLTLCGTLLRACRLSLGWAE